MFWSEVENIKISKVEYVALSSTFNGEIEPYLYEYDNDIGHLYKVSYSSNKQSNDLHRLLKFKLQKRYVAIDQDLCIIGHYDYSINIDNITVIDLKEKQLRFL